MWHNTICILKHINSCAFLITAVVALFECLGKCMCSREILSFIFCASVSACYGCCACLHVHVPNAAAGGISGYTANGSQPHGQQYIACRVQTPHLETVQLGKSSVCFVLWIVHVQPCLVEQVVRLRQRCCIATLVGSQGHHLCHMCRYLDRGASASLGVRHWV